MSERRRGSLYVLATRRPWAEVRHNFVQRRRRPARPACPKKGSRRAPARPPPYIAAPTPRYARRRRERPVGHEAEGTSPGVPAQPRRRFAPPSRDTHTRRVRRRHSRLISPRRGDGVWTALTSRHRSDGRGDGVDPLDAIEAPSRRSGSTQEYHTHRPAASAPRPPK